LQFDEFIKYIESKDYRIDYTCTSMASRLSTQQVLTQPEGAREWIIPPSEYCEVLQCNLNTFLRIC